MRKAPVEDVAAAIVHGARCVRSAERAARDSVVLAAWCVPSAAADALGGLADKKAAVIKRVLDDIYERHGKLSLEHLRTVEEKEALRELVTFDGVGMKTASCVLLFTLGHESFAVGA